MKRRPLFLALVAMAAGASSMAIAGEAGGAPAERQTYVVVLRPGTANVPAVADQLARANGGRVGFV